MCSIVHDSLPNGIDTCRNNETSLNWWIAILYVQMNAVEVSDAKAYYILCSLYEAGGHCDLLLLEPPDRVHYWGPQIF